MAILPPNAFNNPGIVANVFVTYSASGSYRTKVQRCAVCPLAIRTRET